MLITLLFCAAFILFAIAAVLGRNLVAAGLACWIFAEKLLPKLM